MSIEQQPRIPKEEPEKPPENDVARPDVPDLEKPSSNNQETITEPEVRQFSRMADSETRQQLAQEIKERRSSRQKLSEVNQDAAQRATDIENFTKSVDKLRQQADTLSSSVWGKITSWNARARLEALVQRKITLKEVYERQLAELQAMKADTELVLQGRQEVADDEALLASYYGEVKERLTDFQKATRVENVIQEQNALFIHGMGEYIPAYNSVLMPDGRVTFEAKLRIFLSLQPTVSTSTIKEGEGAPRMMHKTGVILSGGTVESADSFDSGTEPLSIKSRNRRVGGEHEQRKFLIDPKSHIAKAVNQKSGPWNELVVSEPEPAALYFAEELQEKDGVLEKVKALQEIGEKYDLPLYCLKNGKPYEFAFELREGVDKHGRGYKSYELNLRKEISTQAISEMKRPLEKARKKELLNEVFRGLPFDPEKIGLAEATHIKNSELGREVSCIVCASQNPEASTTEQYRPWRGERDSAIPEGSSIRIVGDFHALAGRRQYFFYEGKLHGRFSKKIWSDKPWEENVFGEEVTSAYLFFKQIDSPDDFFTIIQDRSIATHKREEEYKVKGSIDLAEEASIRSLKEENALILYGFAEEAGAKGEDGYRERAEALAREIGAFSLEQYKELRARRINNGTFVLFPEDIGVQTKRA